LYGRSHNRRHDRDCHNQCQQTTNNTKHRGIRSDFKRRNAKVLALTHFSSVFPKIQGFDPRLANRPFLVFGFRALRLSGLSARVHESQKLKMVG